MVVVVLSCWMGWAGWCWNSVYMYNSSVRKVVDVGGIWVSGTSDGFKAHAVLNWGSSCCTRGGSIIIMGWCWDHWKGALARSGLVVEVLMPSQAQETFFPCDEVLRKGPSFRTFGFPPDWTGV